MEVLVVVCVALALGSGLLLWDRRRTQQRAARAEKALTGAEGVAQELERKHRFLETILDSIGDPVFVKDREHRYIYVNEAKCRLTGQARDAIIGKSDYEISRPQKEEVDVFVQRDEIVLETGREDLNEEALTGADGILRTVVTRKSLYIDDAGRRCVVGVIRDITEQKHAEDALKRSQAAYLAEAQRLSTTGSFGWNAASGEMSWSHEFFRIFGYDPEAKPSIEAIIERVHPEDRTLVEEVIQCAAKEKREYDFEHRLQMPDGSVKHLHTVAHLLIDEPGTLQFVGAVMDVTAAKQAQEQLQQAQAELAHVARLTVLGEMTASIAHEVGQPLTGITLSGKASLRFLDADPPQLDRARTAVDRMIADSLRAAEIVQRVRALTRKTAPEPERVDLNTTVRECVSLLQREVSRHRVALRQDLAPELPAVLGDRVQLQQVIINLLVNSLQAMATVHDQPRELVIESRRDEAGQVLVSVRDSGVGIDPAHASRLFNAFFTTKPDGMGMGLAICSKIIEAHGGRVWASSNPGPGATFQFRLPAINESEGNGVPTEELEVYRAVAR